MTLPAAANATDAARPCPCGSGRTLGACCGRWLGGTLHLQAPDAERLMRSRYTAYVLEDADYLLNTWHPDTRPARLDFQPGLRWLGLQVRAHVPAADGRHATVAFVARSKLGGRAHRLVETSRFVRLPAGDGDAAGRWVYLDGDLDGQVAVDDAAS